MTEFFFPDNTVLVYFTVMGRQDLLLSMLGERGMWTVTTRGECRASSKVEGLEGLDKFLDKLGDPLIPTPAERVDTALVRSRLAEVGDSPTAHLGEAETIAVVASRQLSALFLTDDIKAGQLARLKEIPVASTLQILRLAVETGRLSADAIPTLAALLEERGRRLRGLPRTGTELHLWLAAPRE